MNTEPMNLNYNYDSFSRRPEENSFFYFLMSGAFFVLIAFFITYLFNGVSGQNYYGNYYGNYYNDYYNGYGYYNSFRYNGNRTSFFRTFFSVFLAVVLFFLLLSIFTPYHHYHHYGYSYNYNGLNGLTTERYYNNNGHPFLVVTTITAIGSGLVYSVTRYYNN